MRIVLLSLLKSWTKSHKQLMFPQSATFSKLLMQQSQLICVQNEMFSAPILYFYARSFEDSVPQKRVQTFSHLQRWSAGGSTFPQRCTQAGMCRRWPLWGTGLVAPRWKCGQTVTFLTLILMLSPPTVLSSSPASRTTLPPADTTQLLAVPGFEAGASQLVRGIIKWK